VRSSFLACCLIILKLNPKNLFPLKYAIDFSTCFASYSLASAEILMLSIFFLRLRMCEFYFEILTLTEGGDKKEASSSFS
jgi:hypothetical protein